MRRAARVTILVLLMLTLAVLPAAAGTDAVTTIQEISDIIGAGYYGPVSPGALSEGAARGLVDALGDVYSTYMSPGEYQDFSSTLSGIFGGIGVTIESSSEGARVSALLPGMPAERAGITIGDVIIAVDGQKVAGKSVGEIALLIRGTPGTNVIINIRDGVSGDRRDVQLERALIEQENITGRMLPGGIGYIQLLSFTQGVARNFEVIYDGYIDLGMKSIILDLRGNGGGLLDEALTILSRLVPSGEIMQIRTNRGSIEVTGGTEAQRLPLVILVDGNSASASEIVSGGVQARKAGTVIGTRTFGKGLIQQTISLSDGGAVKLTIGEYLLPGGVSVQAKGVSPDLLVSAPESKPLPRLQAQRNLKPFMIGLDVLAFQESMAALGWQLDEEPGVMTNASLPAICGFQREAGLAPSGVVDPAFVAELNRQIAAAEKAESEKDPQLDFAVDWISQNAIGK